MCYESQEIGIHASQEICFTFACTPSRHTHAHHAHTHDSMYVNVYTCTHCGPTGQLAKFCYDRINVLNFANKFVWVRKDDNPHGPKKVWVPKSILIVFDVGVGSHKT